jgi:hypothetical protein
MRIDFGMAEAARPAGAQQLDRGIGDLAAALRRVVLSTVGYARSLSP